MISRHGTKQTVPRAGEVCSALAVRWNISLPWLMNGVGEPFDGALEGLDRILAEARWSEETVAAAKVRKGSSGANYSEDEWRAFLRKVETAVRDAPGSAPETGEYATGRK